MYYLRALALAAIAASLMLLTGCCCGRILGRKPAITIPTQGGSITVQPGSGGDQTTTITTPEGSITSSTDGSGNDVKITNEKGETASFGSEAPKDVIDKLDLPMYPGAATKGYADMKDTVSVTLESTDEFAKVSAWYEKALDEGWEKATMGGGGASMATFSHEKDKCSVMVVSSDGKTMVTLMREPKPASDSEKSEKSEGSEKSE